jgi:hypothetical protein
MHTFLAYATVMDKPAHRIIAAFGGINPAARILEIPPSTVQGWKERGFIPASRQSDVLRIAREQGLSISEADFFENTA